jgi:hypothetical protein
LSLPSLCLHHAPVCHDLAARLLRDSCSRSLGELRGVGAPGRH